MAKKDDDPQNENLNKDSDDTFGLPEINYEPLQKKESKPEPEPEPEPEIEPVQEPEPVSEYQDEVYEEESSEYANQEPQTEEEEEVAAYKPYEEEPSIWPKIVGILVVIILALAATWYFVIYQPKQKEQAEKDRIAAEQKAQAKKQKDDADALLKQQQQAAEKRRLDSIAAINEKPAEGTIETLTERTGRYYVVVASALDNDLLMDYAKDLSSKGVGSKIIPPFGKHKVSRICIAEGDTFAAAQEKANALKADYGDAVWVLKY